MSMDRDEKIEAAWSVYQRTAWDIESEYYKRTGEIPARHLLVEFDEQPFKQGYQQGQSDLLEECASGFDEWAKDYDRNELNGTGDGCSYNQLVDWCKPAWRAVSLKKQKEINEIIDRAGDDNQKMLDMDKQIEQLKGDLKWALEMIESDKCYVNVRMIDVRKRHFGTDKGGSDA